MSCITIRHEETPGGLPLCPAPSTNVVNIRATCQGTVDKATANRDVSGYVAERSNHMDLCGSVLDTKFGPKCAVTPCSYQNSTRRRRWKMCHKNDLASTTLVSSCSHGLDSIRGSGQNPDSCGTSPHGLGPWRTFASLDHHAESKLCSWFGTWTAEIGTALFASVLGQVNVAVFQFTYMFIPKASLSRIEGHSSRDHTRPGRSSFALAMILTMNARRFQRAHPL